MNIEFVIQDILHKKNFITIPGFGSFVSNYQPARIIKSDHVKFVPPQKTIVFNPQLQIDDGLLHSVLQSEYKLTYQDATKEIEYFVHTSKNKLASEQILVWDGIGVFSYNDQKSIEFEPIRPHNFLLDSFGFSDFSVHILPKERIIEEYISKKKEKQAIGYKQVIKTAFIISPIIFGAILIPNIIHAPQLSSIVSFFKNTNAYVDFSIPEKPLPIERLENSKLAHELIDKPIIDTQHVLAAQFNNKINEPDAQIPEKTKAIETPPATKAQPQQATSTKPQQSDSFYIIVGSFSNVNNAKKLALELQNQSFNAGVLQEDGKIRVYISTFQSKNEAVSQLAIIKQNQSYSSAWLYSKHI